MGYRFPITGSQMRTQVIICDLDFSNLHRLSFPTFSFVSLLSHSHLHILTHFIFFLKYEHKQSYQVSYPVSKNSYQTIMVFDKIYWAHAIPAEVSPLLFSSSKLMPSAPLRFCQRGPLTNIILSAIFLSLSLYTH